MFCRVAWLEAMYLKEAKPLDCHFSMIMITITKMIKLKESLQMLTSHVYHWNSFVTQKYGTAILGCNLEAPTLSAMTIRPSQTTANVQAR